MIGIHRHGSILGQGTPVYRCAGGQCNARQRENTSRERRTCTEGCRATNLPKHVACLRAVDQQNGRSACGGERAPYPNNEDRVGVTLSVQRERTCKLGRACKAIDTSGERFPAQI